ncbi:hypothetical protein ANCCEY_10547 [Ancylostoma ceylanicum]|uniref:Uncharacterized protein n=2 Tax=Ancylostoma ceylanicum TaxID=53326 RepID=A0A8I3B2Q6_9BILA|nr:hypothetical protein ANCCEY_10547 [Ancylostoma ceylanicum]EYC15559.1 hypothetical protein Y032_0036g3211 [Ancylostoma ceylanicum]
MAFTWYFLAVLLFIQRSYASYPTGGIEEQPAIAIPVEPAPPAPMPAIPAMPPAQYAMPPPVVAPAPVVAPPPIVAPAPAVAPAPVIAHATYAAPQPIVVQAQPIVQPAPVPVPVPYPVTVHHHNPRTELRNTVTGFSKETGHTSATAVVSADAHHAFEHMNLHPVGHVFEDEHHAEPYKARQHRKKLASKKAARKQKTARKHKAARKQKTFEKKN